MKIYDSIIIGGGQAGLSVAYYFRRYPIEYLILDGQKEAGGSWLQTWDSLQLFSPVVYSSLSGWRMPPGEQVYPGKDEFVAYLKAYEQRYGFPIKRPVNAHHVYKADHLFVVETNQGIFHSKTLVSATGSARNPFIPHYPHMDEFVGQQIHSSQYVNADPFVGQNVLVVGGGNSGAQILGELSKVANTQWVTLTPPQFLPDHVDGRYLFQQATNRFRGKTSGSEANFSLGNIVMLDSVKDARRRGVLEAKRPFSSFYEHGVIWSDGQKEAFDAVVWCTGFKPNLEHLHGLNIIEGERVNTKNTRAVEEPNLWLVGYGSWTGFASATIYGVGKTARATAREIDQALKDLAS
ncbi:MAG: ArsO family NAD(P)H-dependent flavin-containing monooxygenase [Chloroflexota bacterium]